MMHQQTPNPAPLNNTQGGFSLLEVLVSMTILGISGLAIAVTGIQSLHVQKLIEINHIANSLAISKMEEFASISTIDIVPGMSAVEPNVSWPGLQSSFSRTTLVTENADDSRTVRVTVKSSNTKLPTTVSFETTFALWE